MRQEPALAGSGNQTPLRLDFHARQPADGRFDLRIVKVKLRRVHRRLCRLQRRLQRVCVGNRVVARLLARIPLLEQLFGTRQLRLGIFKLCLGLRQLGLGLVQRHPVGVRVNLKQHLPLADFRAFDIIALKQNAPDARPHFRLLGTLRPRRKFKRQRHILRHYLHHVDGSARACLLFSRRLVVAPRQHHDRRKHHRRRPNFTSPKRSAPQRHKPSK